MNKKNKRILFILALAVIMTVVAGSSLYAYLYPQKVAIYVFNDNYSAGEPLTEDMLTTIQCDSKILVEGKESDISSRFVTTAEIDDILKQGDSLRMDVTSGMPLAISLLSANGGSSVEMNMDPSKIAISVQADNITGVTPEMKDGTRVNVYTTTANGTNLLFQNIRALTVNRDNAGDISSVTLEVSKDESLKLIYATQNASIQFGLVDANGYKASKDNLVYRPNN